MYTKISTRIVFLLSCIPFSGMHAGAPAVAQEITTDGRVWYAPSWEVAFSNVWVLANMKGTISHAAYLTKMAAQANATMNDLKADRRRGMLKKDIKIEESLGTILEKEEAKLSVFSRDELTKRDLERVAPYRAGLLRHHPVKAIDELFQKAALIDFRYELAHSKYRQELINRLYPVSNPH